MKTPDTKEPTNNPTNVERPNFYSVAFIETKIVGKLALSLFAEFRKIPDDKLTGRELVESLLKRNFQIMTLIEKHKFRIFVREILTQEANKPS